MTNTRPRGLRIWYTTQSSSSVLSKKMVVWFGLYTCRNIRLKEDNAKCRHLKQLNCKGTLRQVIIRVYRLEIANFLCTFSHVGNLNAALRFVISCDAPSPLLSSSTLHPSLLPCVNKYCILYTRIRCVWGGSMGFWASDI